MQVSDYFKKTIQAYLDQRAANDHLFAVNYAKPDKNIDDCTTYILNAVKTSDCNGFADDEIYSMAIHYYHEDDIKVGKPIGGKVVVNHHIELTEEEKQKAREVALKRATDEQYNKIRSIGRKKVTKTAVKVQQTLF